MTRRRILTVALATSLVAAATAIDGPASASAATSAHQRDIRKAPKATRDGARRERPTATASSDPVLCPVDWLDVPESSSTGVVTEWLSFGDSITVTPSLDHQIWAGVWFTGTNGPEGWANTSARSSYPLPGAREYSLIGRFGNGSYTYIGQREMTYTNTTPGVIQRARFRVNDNTPGNGSGAFQVFIRYPCH